MRSSPLWKGNKKDWATGAKRGNGRVGSWFHWPEARPFKGLTPHNANDEAGACEADADKKVSEKCRTKWKGEQNN